MEQRTLKISSQARLGRYERNFSFTPKLILQGNWLEDAGFKIGEHVHLTIEANNILICKPGSKKEKETPGDEVVLNDFTEFLEQQHYEGYTQNLIQNYPQQFEQMLNDFKNNYYEKRK